MFGDFVLDAATPMDLLCGFCGLPAPEEATQNVEQWLRDELNRPPAVGDVTLLGAARLSVREMEGDRITRVGMALGQGRFGAGVY